MIYLDNAATTRMSDAVLNAMLPYFQNDYGNPGTNYSIGKSAKQAVDRARGQVAELIGADSESIIFTSGGSEANNLALLGVKEHLEDFDLTHIIVSAVEHHSVMSAVKSLIDDGFSCTYIKPNKYGVIEAKDVMAAIRPNTGLVCVMYANNETGAVNEVKEIGQLCDNFGILFMTDCVQAAGCIHIDVDEIKCDFASISSHKIHGPKGVGALYCRNKQYMKPLIHGGNEQEFGIRGGTENVPGIVGFGRACKSAGKEMVSDVCAITNLKLLFHLELMKALESAGISKCVTVNGNLISSIGKVISLSFTGVDGETLLMLLNERGVCVAAGSACNSLEQVPSYVLTAMGISDEMARSTIRVSFSNMNTREEVTEAARILSECVVTLKSGCIA